MNSPAQQIVLLVDGVLKPFLKSIVVRGEAQRRMQSALCTGTVESYSGTL